MGSIVRVIAFVAAASLLLSACDRIPGTDAYRIAQGKTAAAELLIDPSSAQFRKLAVFPQPENPEKTDKADEAPKWIVCGELNGKNRNGAYAGFSRFVADPDASEAYLEPEGMATKEEAEEAGETCTRNAKKPLYSEVEREIRVRQCQRAHQLALERQAVVEFNLMWEVLCVPEKKPS